jgi:Gram-negative bacterial TonB protein C-terminal
MNMKQVLVGALSLFFVVVFQIQATAQEAVSTTDEASAGATATLKTPLFKGGSTALDAYMAREAKFPSDITREMKPTDIYTIKFTVKADGSIAEVTHAGHSERHKQLVQHAIRIVANMPAWEPAQINGKAVDYRMTIDVDFTRQ